MKKQFETPEIKPIYTKESVVIVHDDAGVPSIMVKVENTAPSKELADPMFIVRGQEYREIYLSQFLNSIFRGRACSLPFVDPKAYISMDDAIAACRAKGPEWHLLTVPEWNYIIRNTHAGIHGNTDFGTYHDDSNENGVPGGYGRTLTGSGPASWFHNGDIKTGIADVVGNVWKIIAGLRLRRGVLEYMENNDAAAPDADLSFESQEFKPVLVNGLPVKIGPNDEGVMCITTGEVGGYDAVERNEVKIELSEVPQILKDLGIITDNMETSEEWFAADAELDEAVLFGGGSFYGTSNAGPSALYLLYARSYVHTCFGFFSACLGDLYIR